MDSRAFQLGLSILEDRYRELRETGEKRFKFFESESATLRAELRAAKEDREGLEGELSAAKEELTAAQQELDLCLLQLHQVQEELEYYFLESRRQAETLQGQAETLQGQAEKLRWLREQRQLLIRMLGVQGAKFRYLIALGSRIVLHHNNQARQGDARR